MFVYMLSPILSVRINIHMVFWTYIWVCSSIYAFLVIFIVVETYCLINIVWNISESAFLFSLELGLDLGILNLSFPLPLSYLSFFVLRLPFLIANIYAIKMEFLGLGMLLSVVFKIRCNSMVVLSKLSISK